MPENIVRIEDFKDYYQNHLTDFSDVTLTLVDVFRQGDKIIKRFNFKGTHTGIFFLESLPLEEKLILME